MRAPPALVSEAPLPALKACSRREALARFLAVPLPLGAFSPLALASPPDPEAARVTLSSRSAALPVPEPLAPSLSEVLPGGARAAGCRARGAMGPAPKIAPSMLSSDFANLAAEAERMVQLGADWLHMDVMDGHFVPNLTLGAPIVKSLRKHTSAFMDCHLMVTNPADYIQPMAEAGASQFTFHIETTPGDSWKDLIAEIKAKGMRAGVAVKPGTPVEAVFPLVEAETPVDMVLVMTVEPGFGGQKFMPEMMAKVKALRDRFPSLDIEVDGGLGPSTIDEAAVAGANCIVAGSSVFGAPEPGAVISSLREAVAKASC